LPLVSRDVVSPPITSPTATTVWYVGQTQTVTWSTTDLPVNQTNPVGMLVLGYWYNNSENLMLDTPLATNLNYSVGQAQITVPNVPTGSDYIVVLFGDSGNASPEFTILNDASSSTSVAPPVPTGSPGSASPAAPTLSTSPPANSPGNSGGSSTPLLTGSSTTAVSPTATVPTSQTTTSHTSTVVVVTASSTSSSTQSSAAWQKHVPSSRTSLGVALVVVYFAFS